MFARSGGLELVVKKGDRGGTGAILISRHWTVSCALHFFAFFLTKET